MDTITRKLDYQGRIAIPVDYRKLLQLEPEDEVKFNINDNNQIIIENAQPKCVFCGKPATRMVKNLFVCRDCLKAIANDTV